MAGAVGLFLSGLSACPPWLLLLTGYGLGAMSRDGYRRLLRLVSKRVGTPKKG